MLGAEKKFIDKVLKAGKGLSKEILFHEAGILIRSLRKRLRMTQKQLAKRTEVPQSYIAKLESGKTSPSLQTLEKIFRSLGCSLALILVPETDPDTVLKKQAFLAAQKRVKRIAGTMALEEQLPRKEALEEMLLSEQKRLLDSETSKIWD